MMIPRGRADALGLGTAQPLGMPELTGHTCRVTLRDRERLAVNIEVRADSDAAQQVQALGAQS